MTRSTIRAEIDLRRERVNRLRSEMAKLNHDIQIEEAELRGLELAADLLGAGETKAVPNPATPPQTRHSSGTKGRQVGAISKPWREILSHMFFRYSGGADTRQIADLGSEVGLPSLQPRQVTPQMQRYISQGYVIETNGKYLVSAAARERFGIHELTEFLSTPKSEGSDAPTSDPSNPMGAA
jgi:hypothetical protein